MGKKTIIAILSILPIIVMLVGIPYVNRIHPIIFGLPFLVFWLFLWMILTPLINYGIYHLQKAERGAE